MSTTPFEQLPSNPSASERERTEHPNDAWMAERPAFEQAQGDVGEIFSALQQRDGTGIYSCFPLSPQRMKGFVRMFLKGIETGRSDEDIRSDAEDGVKRMSRATKAVAEER